MDQELKTRTRWANGSWQTLLNVQHHSTGGVMAIILKV